MDFEIRLLNYDMINLIILEFCSSRPLRNLNIIHRKLKEKTDQLCHDLFLKNEEGEKSMLLNTFVKIKFQAKAMNQFWDSYNT